MMTALFPTTLPVAALSGYSLVVGLALVDAFEAFGASLRLKWPNDLVVVRDDTIQKVGGVLIEVQDLGEKRVVLVGVGINLGSVPGDVPNASSIEDISGRLLSIEEALGAACHQLRVAHDLFVSLAGFSRFMARWEGASCFDKGRTEITIDLGERTVSGRFAGIDERGSLLLADGDVVTPYHSGHLLHLKNLRA
jgi:BirA family biotin operon repressor/biotin-[acetyl-CoA-carboxylase] ligase